MYESLYEMIDMIAVIFQGWCLQYFYGKFMKCRIRISYGRYITVLVWAAASLLASRMIQADYNSMRVVARLTILYLVLLLAAVGLYQAGNALKLYLSVTFMAVKEISFFLAYMMLAVGDHLIQFWEWCLEKGYISDIEKFLQIVNATVIALQVMMYVCMLLFTFLLLRSIVNRYQEKEYEVQRNELMFILAPSAAGLLFCVLLRMVSVTMENEIPVLLYHKYPLLLLLIPAILLLSLLSIIYGIQLLQDMIGLNREKRGRLILEQQVSSLQEHVQEMDRIQARIQGMKHDMKNQLAVMVQLAEERNTEKLQAHVLQMNQTMEQLDYRFQTGNAAADTILNMKYHEAARQIPDVRVDAEELIFPENMRIQSYDLAVILCNAMDNAIEACRKLKEEDTKFICLRSYQRGSMFFLEVENSFDGQLEYRGRSEFPQSSKRDKHMHGIGMNNIRAAAWKYEGATDWEVEGKTFSLTVMMKNVDKNWKEDEK